MTAIISATVTAETLPVIAHQGMRVVTTRTVGRNSR